MDHIDTEQASKVSSQETAENASPKTDPAFKAKWLAALRSGEYQQGKDALKTDRGYCCMGVAAIVAGYKISTLHDRVVRPGENANDAEGYCALDDFSIPECGTLISMNDSGKSFAEIADYIEANL